jgi:hypothetical protein
MEIIEIDPLSIFLKKSKQGTLISKKWGGFDFFAKKKSKPFFVLPNAELL